MDKQERFEGPDHDLQAVAVRDRSMPGNADQCQGMHTLASGAGQALVPHTCCPALVLRWVVGQVGTCTNRWYDKLQIIVFENGAAGVNFEHTWVDGHTVLRFARCAGCCAFSFLRFLL